MDPKFKRVHFFGLVCCEADGNVRHAPVAWDQRIAAFHDRDVTGRIFKGKHEQLLTLEKVDHPWQTVLGRVVDDTGLRLGHKLTGLFRPVETEAADEFFTKVTYVQFVPDCNAIATVGGAGERPAIGAVESVANELYPLREGSSWVATPLMAPGREDEVKSAPGVSTVHVRMNAVPADLLTLPNADRVQFGEIPDEIASLVGAEISIDLRVHVRGGSKSAQPMQVLRDYVLDAAERWRGRPQRFQARTTGVTSELLDLIQYNLAASVELPTGLTTAQQLQDQILDELAAVVGRWKARVVEATKS